MSIQVDFAPEIETRLKEMAFQNGQDLSTYVKAVIEEKLGDVGIPARDATASADERRHFYFTASQEEWERAFDAIGEGNEDLPVPPLDAFERESLYEDCF